MRKMNSVTLLVLLALLFAFGQTYSSVDQTKALPQKMYLTPNETWKLDLNDYFTGYNLTYGLSEDSSHSAFIQDSVSVQSEGSVAGMPDPSAIADWFFPQEAVSSSVSYFPGENAYILSNDSVLFSGNVQNVSNATIQFQQIQNLSSVVNGTCSNLAELSTYLLVECYSLGANNASEPVAVMVFLDKQSGNLLNVESLGISDKEFIDTIPVHRLLQVEDPSTSKSYLVLVNPEVPSEAMVFLLKHYGNKKLPTLESSFNITKETFSLNSLYIVTIETLKHHILILDETTGPYILPISDGKPGQPVSVPGYNYYKYMTTFVSPSGIVMLFLVEENGNLLNVRQVETNLAFMSFVETSVYVIANFNTEKSPKSVKVLSVYPSDSFLSVLLSFCSYAKSYCDLELRLVENGKGYGDVNDVFAERVLGPQNSGLLLTYNSYWNEFLVVSPETATFEVLTISSTSLIVQDLQSSGSVTVEVISGIGPKSLSSTIELVSVEDDDYSLIAGESTSYDFGSHYPLPDIYPYNLFINGFVQKVEASIFKATARSVEAISLGEINVIPQDSSLGSELSVAFSRVFALGGQSNNGDIIVLTQVGDNTGRYYANVAYCLDNFPEGIKARAEQPKCQEMVNFQGTKKIIDAFALGDWLVMFEDGDIENVHVVELSSSMPELETVQLPFSCLPQGLFLKQASESIVCLDNMSTRNRIITLEGFSLFWDSPEDVIYTAFNLPEELRFFSVWTLPDFQNDFIAEAQDGYLYLVNGLYLDEGDTSLVCERLDELQSYYEGNSLLLTTDDQVIIKNFDENAIYLFGFQSGTNTFELIKEFPLFDCKLIPEKNPSKQARDTIYTLASCSKLGDVTVSGIQLLVHQVEGTYRESFRGYSSIENEGLSIPSTLDVTSAYIPFVNLNLVFEVHIGVNSTSSKSTAVINSYWVFPEPYLECVYQGVQPVTENWFTPAIHQYNETTIKFYGLDGSPVTFSGNYTVTNYMNLIEVNPENNLTEWKTQLMSTDTKEEMILRVNYSAFIKSHISSTDADCATYTITNTSEPPVFTPVECVSGVNDVYVPNKIDYQVLLAPFKLLDTVDSVTLSFSTKEPLFVSISLNASQVQVDFQEMVPGNESKKLHTEILVLNFSVVVPEGSPETVECLKILAESTVGEPGSSVYVLCQDTRMTAYYMAILTLNGTKGWASLTYVDSQLPIHSASQFKLFPGGVFGFTTQEYSPLTDQSWASRLYLYQIVTSGANPTLQEMLVVNPYRIQLEVFSISDYTVIPIHTSEKDLSIEGYHVFLVLGNRPANSTFYCLDLNSKGNQIEFYRALDSPVDQKLIRSWVSIDLANHDEIYYKGEFEFSLLVGSNLGNSYIFTANISMSNTSLAQNHLYVDITYVSYGGFMIQEVQTGNSFTVFRSGSSFFIYPRRFYCNHFDMNDTDFNSCIQYSQSVNMLGEIQFTEYNDMGDIVGFSIIEGEGWDPRCGSHLFIALSDKLHNGDPFFFSNGDVYYVCLSDFLTVTYDNITNSAWTFTFRNYFNKDQTFVYFHKQQGVSIIFWILIFVAASGAIGIAMGVGHFFYRRRKISSARSDMGTIQDSYRKFEEQGRANDFSSRDSSNNSMLSEN